MFIELKQDITTEAIKTLHNFFNQLNEEFFEVITQKGRYLISKNGAHVAKDKLMQYDGVKQVHQDLADYTLVSNGWKQSSILEKSANPISRNDLTIIAGPCAIESEEQMDLVIQHLVDNNISYMRGGIFKPRTSPYNFKGLGIDGLKILSQKAKAKGIKIVSEVMDASQIEAMYDYVDVYQVGARNSLNYVLLSELGKIDKPVLIKRGLSGTIEELLFAAEYVFTNGNEEIILCERGIRTYERAYRNTFDLNAIPIIKEKTHLPVIADPSHGIGIRRFVGQMALAAIMAGADGVMLEVHEQPEKALSDGPQSIELNKVSALYAKLKEAYQLRKSFEDISK